LAAGDVLTMPPRPRLRSALVVLLLTSAFALPLPQPQAYVPAQAATLEAPTAKEPTQSLVRRPGAQPRPFVRRPRSLPHLAIPSIGVDTALVGLGLTADGSLAVPAGGFPAGWYTGGPTPGERGPAVITGHVDWRGPAVFFRLRELTPGAAISITDGDGGTTAFRVSRVLRVSKQAFPTAQVYGDLDHPGLRLVTCGGAFNAERHSYDDNIIVFADASG
jgi:sortase (surface protein transpeptidase)